MRRILAPLALIAAAACSHMVPAASSGEPDRPPALPEGLGAARAGYIAAWGGTDRAALASFFADDAQVVFSDFTLEGRARIEERWLAEDVGRVNDLVMVTQRVSRSGHDVTEAGMVTLRFRGQGGDVRAERGTYEHTWTRTAAGWKLKMVKMDTHPAPAL
ncbi:MAG TPA: nuclear transport factor 2 family protein [Longimicrobium sp.]